jgi:hypothetical protein
MGDPQRAASEIAAAANTIGAPGYGAPAPNSMYGYGAPAPNSMYGAPAPNSMYGYGAPAPNSMYGAPASQSQTLYQQGGQPYVAPAAPAKRGVPTWVWIVGGIVALIIVACIALGAVGYFVYYPQITAAETQTAVANSATATPVATATPNIPAGFTQFTDTTDGYSIAYPSSWEKSTASGATVIIDVTDNVEVVVGAVNGNLSASEISSQEKGFFQSASGGHYSNVKGPTKVTYGGESWTKETADMSLAGQPSTASVMIANHGSKAYIIAYSAPKSSFSTLDQQDFEPMLNTIIFLS